MLPDAARRCPTLPCQRLPHCCQRVGSRAHGVSCRGPAALVEPSNPVAESYRWMKIWWPKSAAATCTAPTIAFVRAVLQILGPALTRPPTGPPQAVLQLRPRRRLSKSGSGGKKQSPRSLKTSGSPASALASAGSRKVTRKVSFADEVLSRPLARFPLPPTTSHYHMRTPLPPPQRHHKGATGVPRIYR